MTLLEFLEARLAEEERDAIGARADTHGHWGPDGPPTDRIVLYDKSGRLESGGVTGFQARHIARFDPVRVLAEVEAKRRIIELLLGYEGGIDGEFGCCHKADQIAAGECPETSVDEIEGLQVLAAAYARHADYRPEWAPQSS